MSGARGDLSWPALAGLVVFVILCVVLFGTVSLWAFAQLVEWVGP